MDIDECRIGQWPNIAIDPRTGRHAATGEEIERGEAMSDNRTTELREKLTERDVKWWPMRNNGYYEDRDTEFVVDGKKHTAHEWGDGLAVYNLTPEQAIAATLGSEREKALEELVQDWQVLYENRDLGDCIRLRKRMQALGIEVIDA